MQHVQNCKGNIHPENPENFRPPYLSCPKIWAKMCGILYLRFWSSNCFEITDSTRIDTHNTMQQEKKICLSEFFLTKSWVLTHETSPSGWFSRCDTLFPIPVRERGVEISNLDPFYIFNSRRASLQPIWNDRAHAIRLSGVFWLPLTSTASKGGEREHQL